MAGKGLYDLSEDSWYAEDAHGKKVEKENIPKIGGFYEASGRDASPNSLFSGYHWGEAIPKKRRKTMYFGCTGPSMGLIPPTPKIVGFGETWEEALANAKRK